MKCHFDPKSWSRRATPKSLFCAIAMLALYPMVLTESHRAPAIKVQPVSLPAGSCVVHIFATVGLSPTPRGSTDLRLYCTSVPAELGKVTIPASKLGEGT